MTTLCIDAAHDEATQEVYNFRMTYVYPKLTFTPTYIFAEEAVPLRVSSALSSPDFILITGSGHGDSGTFMGYERQSLFSKSDPDLNLWFSNRIVHLLSCETAKELGLALKEQGCTAFFGYTELVTFDIRSLKYVLECDSEILISLLSGLSPQEAYQRTIDRYDIAIKAAQRAYAIRTMQFLSRMKKALRLY